MVPPLGYSINEFENIGQMIENKIKKHWQTESEKEPLIARFFYVAHSSLVFMGAVAKDPQKARQVIPVLQNILRKIPGMIIIVKQTSLFAKATASGRSIDIDISGPDLERLFSLVKQIFGMTTRFISGAQLRSIPSLDLGNQDHPGS